LSGHRTEPPQLFVAVTLHLPAQAAVLSGVHPHCVGLPPPPQVCGAEHALLHATVSPQLFVAVPLHLPTHAPRLSGVHPQTVGSPPPPQV